MTWYQRTKTFIQKQEKKANIPDNYWFKTEKGKIIDRHYLEEHAFVAPDGYHFRIDPKKYFALFFDEKKYEELFADLTPQDPLHFIDTQAYPERVKIAQEKTKEKEALQVGFGTLAHQKIVIAAMDFRFIGGSMGSVMGEKISKAIDFCIEKKCPLMIISQTGGARMMEAAFSLMQMAKVSAKLRLLAEAQLPYISYMTHPTTGGVSASFAMLGDFNIAEPGALIGFAGPRVVKETIGRDLPEGFQTSEFLLEHGFLDFIIDRRTAKEKLALLLNMFS